MADPRLSRLLDAVLAIGSGLELESVLRSIADAACDLVGAKYAALGVVGDDAFLSQFVHVGMADNMVARIGHLPEGHGILGYLIKHPTPLRLEDLTQHPASFGVPEGHPPMGTFLGAPVRVSGQVYGNLYLTEKRDGYFTEGDEELVVALAAAAGSAIANAVLHQQVQRLSVIEDRERIGRDLHDTVIQRLFATGLTLQSVAKRVEVADAVLARRVVAAVDDLDDTIREIRGVIFSLQTTDGEGLRDLVQGVVDEVRLASDLETTARFEGPVDLVVDEHLRPEVVAVVREGLTNAVRHARAKHVEVLVKVTGDQVTVEVRDDGVGPGGGTRVGGMGLGNLAGRAAARGGSSHLLPRQDRPGTVLRWVVPA